MGSKVDLPLSGRVYNGLQQLLQMSGLPSWQVAGCAAMDDPIVSKYLHFLSHIIGPNLVTWSSQEAKGARKHSV